MTVTRQALTLNMVTPMAEDTVGSTHRPYATWSPQNRAG
jgi:hypothetical protein